MTLPLWVAQYIGVPFKVHGRDRSGVDCYGLARLVLAEQFKIDLPSLAETYIDTKAKTSGERIETEITAQAAASWQEIAAGSERVGDVVVIRQRGYAMHIGVVLGDSKMLHVEESAVYSVIEAYDGLLFQTKIQGFYRYAAAG